ncbi:MAG TPA: pyrroloquinoline quinone biosynthesis peptide chaperone PqqD [Steroidobacteraceae bacterium]|jgi:pyrroloquinoline quinone biosynthesis protein D|nr:pyrroloquinoline quinone biosynthesis peptide chaperone PqqD [Steroidobacteraceae bacterium]
MSENTAAAPAPPPAIAAMSRPAIARGFRLQWEPAQNAHVLLYPEGMVKLNGSAGEILKRCDGQRTVSEIVQDLEEAFNAPDLTNDVTSFMTFAVERKWLEIRE